MYYKRKNTGVSTTKQSEDKFSRYDYNRTVIEISSGIRGAAENIIDSR